MGGALRRCRCVVLSGRPAGSAPAGSRPPEVTGTFLTSSVLCPQRLAFCREPSPPLIGLCVDMFSFNHCGPKASYFIRWDCNPWLSLSLTLSLCPGQTAGCAPGRKRHSGFDENPYRVMWPWGQGSCSRPGRAYDLGHVGEHRGVPVHPHDRRKGWDRLFFKALFPSHQGPLGPLPGLVLSFR